MDNPAGASEVIRDAFQLMHRRASLLVSLPVEKLDRIALEGEAKKVAQATGIDAPSSSAPQSTS